jgi:hypothetical protein
MTPAELFDRAGRALYGDHYVAPMAVLLGLDKSLVLKMRNGKADIRRIIWSAIRDETINRRAELKALSDPLGSAVDGILHDNRPK